jgi:hypothetical protein
MISKELNMVGTGLGGGGELMDQSTEFGFYSKNSGKLLVAFMQQDDSSV